jgi:hypothetical protein
MKRFREDVYALRFAAISPAASLLVWSARFVALCCRLLSAAIALRMNFSER